jgi:hypothetical protein
MADKGKVEEPVLKNDFCRKNGRGKEYILKLYVACSCGK